MPKDYYKTLGLSKGADEKEIKASYRKLARKYHPDVNPGDAAAEAKFKEVGEAYEVLSDPDKRRKYDMFGEHWETGGMHGPGPGAGGQTRFQAGDGFESIFEQFFGGMGVESPFGGFRQRQVAPSDVETQLDVTLEEIDAGSTRKLVYQTMDACTQCRGGGQVKLTSGQTGPCPTCRGGGLVGNERQVSVKVPAGIASGKKLRVAGRGVTGSNGKSGDLYVVVNVLPHKLFKRRDDDLEVDLEVPYHIAALGGDVKVPTLHGSGTIHVSEGTQAGQLFRLKGKGLTKMGGTSKGDLLARAKITVPKHLEQAERKLLEQIRDKVGNR
ncbi:MAG: J domain-containing protein [Armatimonadetes bacterium]|nr:J domain-containing protein [Armatimonadota bacterium]